MSNDLADNIQLLPLCAILRWFDHALLLGLADADESQIVSLLATDLVTPSLEHPGGYCLQVEVREHVLANVRAARPLDEVDLHARVFEYFLSRMEMAALPDLRLSVQPP